MSMRRLLSVTAGLARLVPAARSATARLSPAVRCLAPAVPPPVRTALSRYGPAAPLATSAAAAAARTEPPPPPATGDDKRAIELDLSAVHSKRRVQRKRALVKNEAAAPEQPSADQVSLSSPVRFLWRHAGMADFQCEREPECRYMLKIKLVREQAVDKCTIIHDVFISFMGLSNSSSDRFTFTFSMLWARDVFSTWAVARSCSGFQQLFASWVFLIAAGGRKDALKRSARGDARFPCVLFGA